MNYALLVLASPFSGDTVATAQAFARAVLARGHSIQRVFFYGDGALNGSANHAWPQDETDPVEGWRELAREHGVELVLCISSALKRGMLDDTEARRHDKSGPTVYPEFVISGLGQLIDASASCDRIVTFGG